jgi:hypothetical protein
MPSDVAGIVSAAISQIPRSFVNIQSFPKAKPDFWRISRGMNEFVLIQLKLRGTGIKRMEGMHL